MTYKGIVTSHLSATTGVIQDQRTGENLFFFIDDCENERMPRTGDYVTFERDGVDTVANVKIQRESAA